MTVNTAYLGSGQTTRFTSNVSVDRTLTMATGVITAASVSALTVTGASALQGAVAVGGSGISMVVGSATSQAPVDTLNVAGARFLSRHTTASATSVILRDGEMGIFFESVTSCRLCFRSGVTTYTWIATTGAVL